MNYDDSDILFIAIAELMKYPYVFAENGLVAYKNGKLEAEQVKVL